VALAGRGLAEVRGTARSGGEGEGFGVQGPHAGGACYERRRGELVGVFTSDEELRAAGNGVAAEISPKKQRVRERRECESSIGGKGPMQKPLGDLYRLGRRSGSGDGWESNGHQWPWV
jgi:hypothetical protein